MIIPHLFRIENESGPSVHNRFIVKIALTDYTPISTRWMDDDTLPEGEVLRPSVDITLDSYTFSSEAEAIKFIGAWWTFRELNLKSLKKRFEGNSGPWLDYIEKELERME